MDNKTTVIAVAGALVLGAVGTNALADDESVPDDIGPVEITQEENGSGERDDDRDDRRENAGSNAEPARDADDVDLEPRDEDDDGAGDGGDSNSAAAAPAGGDDSSAAAAAPAPAPAPAPVYDDDGGSDYGDT